MKLEHWQNILRTYRQVRSLLDQSLPPEPTSAQERIQVRVGSQGLALLQQQLLFGVEALRGSLGAAYGEQELDEALRPFVYLVDELVRRRLAGGGETDWPTLHQQPFGAHPGR